MYESKIEKLLDDCTLKRYDKRARIYFALLNDLPQEELDELIDYIEYLDFNELAILHIGFAVADARYTVPATIFTPSKTKSANVWSV